MRFRVITSVDVEAEDAAEAIQVAADDYVAEVTVSPLEVDEYEEGEDDEGDGLGLEDE